MPPVIRPFSSPTVPPNPAPAARPSSQARAAQQAFFRQALGAAAPMQTAPVQAARVEPAAARPAAAAGVTGRIRPLPEEPPQRLLRPGSFVDIKV